MTPSYKILIDGEDRTTNFNLVSMNIKDEMGEKSDSLEITVDDENHQTMIPNRKVIIEPSIGSENKLVICDRFILDHTEITGFPAMMTLFASAAPLNSSMGSKKEKSWVNRTIAEIVNEIAGSYEMLAALDGEVGAIKIDQVNQTTSDLHFLRSLARQHGAIFKIQSNHLVFVKKGKSASGLLKKIVIDTGIKRDWRYVAPPLSEYTGVKAQYYDENKNIQNILIGDEEQVMELKTIKASKEEATRIADARLKNLQSGDETLSFWITITKELNPIELTAGQTINVKNLRDGIDGDWLIKALEHNLSKGKFETRVECVRGNQ